MLEQRVPRDEITAVMLPAYVAAAEMGCRPLASRFEALARRARISPTVQGNRSAPADETGPPEQASAPGGMALASAA